MKKITLTVISLIMICSLMFTACSSSAAKEIKKEDTYAGEAEAMNIFDSTVDNAMPQTVMTVSELTVLKILKTMKTVQLCILKIRAVCIIPSQAAEQE